MRRVEMGYKSDLRSRPFEEAKCEKCGTIFTRGFGNINSKICPNCEEQPNKPIQTTHKAGG